MRKFLLLACGLALAGCATDAPIGMGDCKGVNWYNFGFRDGSVSGLSSLDRYDAYCAANGVQPDAAEYARGLTAGQWDKAHRRF